MASERGGRRAGAGRKPGSKNKATIAREAVAEVLDIEDCDLLDAAVHRRGHTLLLEMERIASDPTQPATIRIMAARTALPFLLARPKDPPAVGDRAALIDRIEEGRRRVAEFKQAWREGRSDAISGDQLVSARPS